MINNRTPFLALEFSKGGGQDLKWKKTIDFPSSERLQNTHDLQLITMNLGQENTFSNKLLYAGFNQDHGKDLYFVLFLLSNFEISEARGFFHHQ